MTQNPFTENPYESPQEIVRAELVQSNRKTKPAIRYDRWVLGIVAAGFILLWLTGNTEPNVIIVSLVLAFFVALVCELINFGRRFT